MKSITAVSSKSPSGRRLSVSFVVASLASLLVSQITIGFEHIVRENTGLLQNQSAVQQTAPISTLTLIEPGKPVVRELNSGQQDQFRVTLASNQYLEVSVEQRGIDVGIRFFGADDKKLADINRVKGTKGSETLRFVADASGDFRTEVRSTENNASPCLYEIGIVALRISTADERTLEQPRRFS